MPKVAVILAGCGMYDGAEIHEAVLTLLSLDQQGVEYQCFAPDVEQMHVINHITGDVVEGESRNVLVEAARIARGNIQALAEANLAEFDGLVVPGGFGAAKNLSNFAVAGVELSLQADFLQFTQSMHRAGKPIALLCIAPAMAVAICGEGSQCTIGNDAETAAAINAMGGEHITCSVDACVVDTHKKLVTTPAYMLAGSVNEAYLGISESIKALLVLIDQANS